MRTFLRAAALTAAAVAIGSGLTVAASSPASAAAACPAGKYCLYDGADYTKLLVTSDTRLVTWIGAANNDKVSSVVNNTDSPLNLFKDVNYAGAEGNVAPHSKAVLVSFQNNNLSSYYLY
ncbi:MAG: hypothetical protein QOJ50_3299 [Cryptosporangiaceae bacterium]|nr:hypothetical protein [Cryptosporangiaceae bacterium]